MSAIFIDALIKHIGIYLSLCFCYIKILNIKGIKFYKHLALLSFTIIMSLIQYYMQPQISTFYRLFIVYFSYSIILGKITNIKYTRSVLTTLLAIAISNTLFIFSTFIVAFFTSLIARLRTIYESPILVFIISTLTYTSSFALFRIKRFKNGIPFFTHSQNNEYFDIILLTINIIIIFTYFFIGNITVVHAKYLILSIIFFGIISFFIIQKAFILYQKQKLQLKALKDYEQELAETKEKLEIAIAEKEKLVKSNHEFYHRQEALNKKLDDLISEQQLIVSAEFGEDVGNLKDRITALSNEYVEKTKTLPKLPKTNITEIDDMLSYLQSECDKNHIEFIVKIECDIQHIIDNYISKSQLETLLGDMIRNSIIAINHTQNNFKSIMLIFGIKDNDYEICIYDSGITFETITLINLGFQPASTHLNEGGTGIGFITTFETINSCNASFIINEETNNNYSKSFEIKFDNKHEYIIISKRTEELQKLNTINRPIQLKG
ncbi:MAG: hypothetical protein K6B70_00740 [Clostridia bacterium]|nr:hypothetical protein [Clostridia bacterium]